MELKGDKSDVKGNSPGTTNAIEYYYTNLFVQGFSLWPELGLGKGNLIVSNWAYGLM